jgi:CheY-like chemotaxis protein
MHEKGGVLDVKITDAQLSPEETKIYPDLSPGDYVNLTVSDTGHGIPRNVLSKIFDPFYTTKKEGEGTGLGLSVVHGIVSNMGGTIKVRSDPDKGTTFEIFLPAIKSEEEISMMAQRSPAKGNERILFVDDEPMLIDIVKRMLQSLSYKVTASSSPIEALDIFRSQADNYDLVITDLTMPQMTGDKLSHEIVTLNPDIPIILCTGFGASIPDEKARSAGIRAFLKKPIVMSEIAETIRKVLDENSGPQ